MTKKIVLLGAVALLFVAGVCSPLAAQDDQASYRWSLWLGSHYTGLEDFSQRVGEYNRGEEEAMPEVKFMLSGQKGFNNFDLRGHFYDPDRADFLGRARIADQLKLDVRYRSVARQRPTDLMGNLLVRESTNREGTVKGGKMITSEDLSPGMDYGYTRYEISTDIEFSPKNADWLTLSAAHRSIMEKGDDQQMAVMHCSSCHIESQAVERDRASHAIQVGATADKEEYGVGYQFDFQTFKSNAKPATVMYDSAANPGNGTMGDEFASRVQFEDVALEVGLIPEVQKMAHALQGRYNLGKGTILARASTMEAKNKDTDLKTTVIAGNIKYSTRLNSQAALRVQARGSQRETDDYAIDVPLFREGRGGGGQDLDYVRYSSMTRREGLVEGELTYRVDRRTRFAVLAGYEAIQRDDYPNEGAKQQTNRYIGQVKVSHRASAQVNGRFKYRLELTDDPFTNYNGLFERAGQDILEQNPVTGLAYYYQREALRTGDITTQPTMSHAIDASVNLRPSAKFSAQIGGKVKFDKNDDLDSLEYERTVYQPTLSATFTPQPEWSIFGSYSYLFDESKVPVAVALMDG